MSYTVTTINGVTKTSDANRHIYSFGVCTIIGLIANAEMVITYNNQASLYQQPQTIAFADISPNLGATTIEEYLDEIATLGYFLNPENVLGLIEDAATNETTTSKVLAPNGTGGVEWVSGNGDTGWGYYADTAYTTESRLFCAAGLTTQITNNKETFEETYLPTGVSTFWASNKLTPENIGDSYDVRLNFMAEAGSANTYFKIRLDIGDGEVISVLETEKTFAKGTGIEHPFSTSNIIFSLSTFVTNGGKWTITPNNDVEIWDITMLITRTHKGNG